MTITIEAKYENGVLKPLGPLPIPLHDDQIVRVTVQTAVSVADSTHGLSQRPGAPHPGETPEKFVLRTAGKLGSWDPQLIHQFAMDPDLEYEPLEDE